MAKRPALFFEAHGTDIVKEKPQERLSLSSMVAISISRWQLRKNDGVSRFESKLVISHISLAILTFYGGLFLGMTRECPQCHPPQQFEQSPPSCPSCPQVEKKEEKSCPPCRRRQEKNKEPLFNNTFNVNHYMPKTVSNIFTGIGRVNREAFTKAFDIGVPISPSIPGNEDVLLLYGKNSLPDGLTSSSMATDAIPTLLDPEAATKNCLIVNVVTIRPDEPEHCLAVVGQWPSYHVHKFMRIKFRRDADRSNGKLPNLLSTDNPFLYSAKTQSAYEAIGVPLRPTTELSYSMFTEYLSKMKETSERLKPVAKSVAKDGKTIIVMLCNQGQSELFINFVCSARSRKLDTSNILLFASDTETKELAEGLGITTFYDENIFGSLPKKAAEYYGDMDFTKMMLAKVYCVHLINMLNYNVLFQDVDIVWYRDPLEFFLSKEVEEEFDMIFQDDGARITRYEPYSPNTGFYFVRYNIRTFHFLSCLIRMGDKIIDRGSHQEALNILLGEHQSLYGLRLKVLNRDENSFPGGFHFHRRPDYMKDFARGKEKPYIFHMSWTENKNNKRLYLEQMGDFLVKDQCIGKTIHEIRSTTSNHDLVASCCMAEGPVICHYRDKPSKIPCTESPPIDKGMKSFW